MHQIHFCKKGEFLKLDDYEELSDEQKQQYEEELNETKEKRHQIENRYNEEKKHLVKKNSKQLNLEKSVKPL